MKFFGTRKNAEKTRKTRGKRRKTRGKRGKFRGKLRILKIFSRTRCVADGAHADAARCRCRFQNADALQYMDEGTENEVLGDPSDVENLRRPDLPSAIWEVLEAYSDVFASELPKGVPPVRMGHEFKIDLEDQTPPIHLPLYKLSPLELNEAQKQIQEILEHEFICPSDSPYGSLVLFIPKKDGNLRYCIDYH